MSGAASDAEAEAAAVDDGVDALRFAESFAASKILAAGETGRWEVEEDDGVEGRAEVDVDSDAWDCDSVTVELCSLFARELEGVDGFSAIVAGILDSTERRSPRVWGLERFDEGRDRDEPDATLSLDADGSFESEDSRLGGSTELSLSVSEVASIVERKRVGTVRVMRLENLWKMFHELGGGVLLGVRLGGMNCKSEI
jgi:hypothetical protein